MTQLSLLVSSTDPHSVIQEIKLVHSLISATDPVNDVELLYADIVALFNGKYPEFRASNTKYHDLEHTNLVALAAARLMHGCFLNGYTFIAGHFFLGVAAALFHDVGMIQSVSEQNGSGATFTLGHEERSIQFMQRYLLSKNFSRQTVKDCAALIRCTTLNLRLKDIPFRNKEIETLGKIIGSADLLGQMADRCYLEKLLLLFKEFEEANLPGFDSELDLLQKTEDFYESIAKERLINDFDNVAACMRRHFKERWNEDHDLYSDTIRRNIDYLKQILEKCRKNRNCYLQNLRRCDIVKKHFGDLVDENPR